jgi:hypothetical protein
MKFYRKNIKLNHESKCDKDESQERSGQLDEVCNFVFKSKAHEIEHEIEQQNIEGGGIPPAVGSHFVRRR